MKVLFHMANALLLPPATFFAWNYYRYQGKSITFKRLWISMVILLTTTIITSLQFVFPEIVKLLERDRQAIYEGELWRLITPLFIQPMGIWQCLFNALFFISFVPLAEHLYGRSIIFIYFIVSILTQLIILYWQTTPGGLQTGSGGSSSAIYSVMGAVYSYVFLNQKKFPRAYIFLPIAGFIGAIILVFFEDGHAPSTILGGIAGFIIQKYNCRFLDTLATIDKKGIYKG